ncbi:subtilase family protein [Actinidia rufa]|uniref:Subtilase family protein n=1 Tax=Actinidia rufa TaxID=165716 RepID=A0A7J0EP05_9ERIC|nr:subtilase family protein [Actinidia rufa]
MSAGYQRLFVEKLRRRSSLVPEDNDNPDDVLIEKLGHNEVATVVQGDGDRILVRTSLIHQARLSFPIRLVLKEVMVCCASLPSCNDHLGQRGLRLSQSAQIPQAFQDKVEHSFVGNEMVNSNSELEMPSKLMKCDDTEKPFQKCSMPELLLLQWRQALAPPYVPKNDKGKATNIGTSRKRLREAIILPWDVADLDEEDVVNLNVIRLFLRSMTSLEHEKKCSKELKRAQKKVTTPESSYADCMLILFVFPPMDSCPGDDNMKSQQKSCYVGIALNRRTILVTIPVTEMMDIKSSSWRGASKRLYLVILAFLILQSCLKASAIFAEATSNVHIVYMGEKQYEDSTIVRKLHHKMLSTLLGSKEAARSSILYSYKHGFSGFAARLTKFQAEKIAEFPGVVQVFPNRIHKLHTTRSWDFLGLRHHSPKNLVTESNMGDGKIIGVIDSGVWPESESFNDEGMSPIPSHWKGTCQHGAHFDDSNCNKKLIGARWFIEGFKHQVNMPINITNDIEFLSPRDKGGHGTHTASTAAGSFVENANYKGLASGVARGGAPLAHVAIYKACWSIGTGGCADADLLKAFDKAIDDGVDILSVSIGIQHSFQPPLTGPSQQPLRLETTCTLMGQSLDTGKQKHGFTGLVYSERIALDPNDNSAKACHIGSLNATLAAGKVVLCFLNSDEQNMIYAAVAVHQAGGIGLIYAHYDDNLLESCDVFPCVRVDYEAGTQILSYIRKARHPTVKLSFPKTVIGESAAPRAAYFSARGPSSISPGVLKPDVAAPGVSILAAYPPLDKDHRAGYALLSGTSMACPHVSGIVALIKSEAPKLVSCSHKINPRHYCITEGNRWNGHNRGGNNAQGC